MVMILKVCRMAYMSSNHPQLLTLPWLGGHWWREGHWCGVGIGTLYAWNYYEQFCKSWCLNKRDSEVGENQKLMRGSAPLTLTCSQKSSPSTQVLDRIWPQLEPSTQWGPSPSSQFLVQTSKQRGEIKATLLPFKIWRGGGNTTKTALWIKQVQKFLVGERSGGGGNKYFSVSVLCGGRVQRCQRTLENTFLIINYWLSVRIILNNKALFYSQFLDRHSECLWLLNLLSWCPVPHLQWTNCHLSF